MAIGGLVQQHTLGLGDEYTNSWENKKFAFVIPFKKRRITHLFPADSYAIGPSALGAKTLCIAEEETAKEAESAGWPKEKIVTRKKDSSLREVIYQCIQAKNGWPIQTKPGQGGLVCDARFEEGPYRFFDLAQPYFYSSFLAPHQNVLTFGPATDAHGEAYGGVFKQFDIKLCYKAYHCYHSAHGNLILDIFEKEEIQFHVNFASKLLEWNEFTNFITAKLTPKAYNEWLSWVYYSLQMMQLDLILREETGYFLILEFETDYPTELLQFRDSLFEETQKTQAKESLIQKARIREKYEELKMVIDCCKPSLRQVNKLKVVHTFGEKAQLEILRNLPQEHFLRYLPAMIPIAIGDKGSQSSLMLCAQLCYFIDKYLSTQYEHYLVRIQASINEIQQELSLSNTPEVFHFMAQNHPSLSSFLLNLIKGIDRESSLYPIGQKFKKHFGIRTPNLDAILEESRLNFLKPMWTIAAMEENLKDALTENNPNMQRELLEIWFFELESCFDALAINSAGELGLIEISEYLTTWRVNYPTEWNSLLHWLSRIPKEHPKVQEWNQHLKNAEKWHQKNLNDEKRFFVALREGNALKLI